MISSYLDVFDCLAAVISNGYVGGDLLSVVVDLPIKSHFQVDLSVSESETLAYKRARETTTAGQGSVLQLQRKEKCE